MEALLGIVGAAISVLILFAVIRGAVLSALETHYKTVRWYERTGEWAGRKKPRPFESAQDTSNTLS